MPCEPANPPMLPPELQVILDSIQRGKPFRSIEEANRVLAERMREYNERPQDALSGLSPDEVAQLLNGDWRTQGALRLAEEFR
jgi:hypothetical protein